MPATPSISKHSGSCHCGAVRFEVELDATQGSRCNCRICTKLGATTSIVKPDAFALLTAEDALNTWGSDFGRRSFCKHCGIFCFSRGHLPEIGGDYVSVNLHCLDDIDPSELTLVYWDGRHDNWQAGTRSTPWPIHAPA